ncbi:hypothetical protein [Mycobacterium hubeiense]|uniref:hypothetical protein n=1 Tax=Mycobacterium hubeiense TaxID=1867256 RepID=UPI000C7EF71B|nr:hypothetical protein [Mycobacterium sp. QGD 101]
MRPVVFLDTETTRKDRDRRPWEIAMIRRDESGEQELTIFIDTADLDLDNADPEALAVGGFHRRHPQCGAPLNPGARLCSGAEAAVLVWQWTKKARVYGVVPSFDTECLDELLHRHELEWGWHFQPWDIAVLATGYLLGRQLPLQRCAEATSLQCGVTPPTPEQRHTAMGDARWVARWYDHLMASQLAAAAA